MAETRTPLLDGNPFADGAEDAGGYVSPERGRNSLSASVSGHGNAAAPAAGSRFSGPLFYACPFILANEFCERLAYYGAAASWVGGGRRRARGETGSLFSLRFLLPSLAVADSQYPPAP